jgi:site-specific DNA-methyltransferase (adenine-specific)
LIYIDPPFNSKRNYNVLFDTKLTEEAFTDTWSTISYLDELEGMSSVNTHLYNFLKMLETTGIPKSYISYLTNMAIRCWYMREMLKDTGSLYFHCDPTMSHYIKMILDYVFGVDSFINEIVWKYSGTGSPKSNLKRKHDIIFLYSKTNDYTFNVQTEPYTKESTIKRFDKIDENGERYKNWTTRGKTRRVYMKEQPLTDVWEIDVIGATSGERLGYPTQKPEALLERIIKASSNEGDLVADFFMGGGTTIATTQKLNRKFIGSDINSRSIQITQKRLEALEQKVKEDFFILGIPRSSEELRQLVADNVLGRSKNSRFDLEEVTVKHYLNGVIGNEKKVGDHSIDGYFSFKYQDKVRTGLVQVTTTANMNHLKAFCSEISKGTGELGVYVSFADKVTNGMIREVKSYGKLGQVDKIQILTFEELIDEGKQFELPTDGPLTM